MQYLILHFLCLIPLATAATSADWRSRSIYQVFVDRFARTDGSTTASCNVADNQYCGGTWRGLINKLDYIQNMGFTAVWISPITHNIESSNAGDAYHGYWQDDIYSLNEHFGTRQDLIDLAAALHQRNMYFMVGAVVNHFAWGGSPGQEDYSKFRPFNDQKYFHYRCPIDNYDDQWKVENCWLGYDTPVELADVDTTRQDVKDTYNTWISDLVDTYSIDGLRLDTAKHVQKDFWPPFVQASGVFGVGEVNNGDYRYTCDYLNYIPSVLNYPLYWPVTRAFRSTSGSISELVRMVNDIKNNCKDSTLMATFLDNHDVARFPSLTSSNALARNAISFTFLSDGIPIIYQGTEQHYSGTGDPYDREAVWLSGYSTSNPYYTFITKLNKLRNWAISKAPENGRDGNGNPRTNGHLTYKAWPIYNDDHTIAMRKGFDGEAIVGVFTNAAEGAGEYTLTISQTGYAQGSSVLEVLSCQTVTVGQGGNLAVPMARGEPKIFYPASRLGGSGICGF